MPNVHRLLAAVALAACGGSACSSADARDTRAPQSAPLRAVEVQPVRAVDETSAIPASGILEATRTIDIAFQIPGKVTAVVTDEGAEIREGALVAAVDSTDTKLSLERARISLQRNAEELVRLRALHASGSLAPNDLEKATAAEQTAVVNVAQAQKQLRDARLYSPISGVVARRAIDPGETAAPGVPVFTIAQLDPMELRVGIPEADVGSVRVGQRATVTVPALGGRELTGRVTLVGVTADPTTRTYTTKITLPNADRALRVGMVAEARIAGSTRVRALTIPGGAIVRDAEGATLAFVLDGASATVHARRVEIGAPRGLSVEILSGLREGDLVVVGGQHDIRDGMKVRATRQEGS
ncbi:efflux transporter, RND family, MFP subunit (plasmid) [Gemmatirosa kalamazoonensis]|uniref:Efflux transporter, RND family, MFP subunit n=1 Tax=Gemmatirosa kalamazoonensis TaxID=861299 RepID=W0RTT6_9BACT|nr:efflux RND transporter periplasmic adaptor subunit [Gemmatirosa kalamazoonensis]AHG93008.1 efflux transporter, RND family, MFP subunit [Gemmatirosa kalamazoonensis]